MNTQLFISAVSDEFRSYRDELRKYLDRPNVAVKAQEHFIATGSETLDKLDDYIRRSDAVIHLVGDMTGSLAHPRSVEVITQRYPDLAKRLAPIETFLGSADPGLSYTQWEAWLAIYHRKPLFIAVPESTARRGEKYLLDESQRAAQRLHLERLKSINRHDEIRFDSPERLVAELSRSRLLEILAPKPHPAADSGLGKYLDAMRTLQTHGYVFARNAARDAAFLYVSLRGQNRLDVQTDEPCRLDQLLASENKSLWISAAPGAGKTTLLRHLARSAWSAPSTIGLQSELLPAFVRLRCVAQSPGASLSQQLKVALGLGNDIHSDGEIPDDFLERWKLQAGCDWLLLLDGIDEVAEKDRPAIFEWIAQVIGKGYRVVVTSRMNISPPSALDMQFANFTILPLSEKEQTELVDGLLHHKASGFLEVLNDANRRWVRGNPLLLSLAAFVFQETGSLPRRRVDLYERAVAEWLHNADTRNWQAALSHDLIPAIDETLKIVAFAMSRDTNLLLVSELVPIIAPMLAELTGKPLAFYQLPGVGGHLIRTLGRHTGFFEVLGDRCTWVHATFREYFTARYISERVADPAQAEFFQRAGDPAWRHILLMLLTLEGDKKQVDEELLSLATTGADGALFATQALIEGVSVSRETALLTVRKLVEFTVLEADESFCNSALTRGHNEKKERLRLCRMLISEPAYEGPIRWLKNTIAAQCRKESQQLQRRLSWNPQWFDYLCELGASDTLVELCDDESLPLLTRAIALNALSNVAEESALARLESLFEAARGDSVASSILAAVALRSGRINLALRAFSCTLPDWLAINDVLDALAKRGSLPDGAVFAASKPHPRAAIAIAFHGEPATIAEDKLALLRRVLEEYSSAGSGTALDNRGPTTESIAALARACGDQDEVIDQLLEYAAREGKALSVVYQIAETLPVDAFGRWLERPTLSVGAGLILTDGVSTRMLTGDELEAVERAYQGWKSRVATPDAGQIMHRFIDARFAIKKQETSSAGDALREVLEHPDILLPFGTVSVDASLASASSQLISQIQQGSGEDVDAALATLSASLERNPKDLHCRNKRASLLHDSGRYEEAVRDHEWIVENHFGIAAAFLGKFAEAVSRAYIFSQSIKLGISGRDNPVAEESLQYEYDREAMANFADSLRLVGRFGQAATIAAALTNDHSWKVTGHRLRGMAFLVVDPEQALEELNAAIAADEAEVYARRTRAYLHRLNGNLLEARTDVDRLLELKPDDIDGLHLRLEMSAFRDRADVAARHVAEFGDRGVLSDMLRFADLVSTGPTAESLALLDAAVVAEYGDLLESTERLNAEGIAHLITYAVLLPSRADPLPLIEIAIKSHHLTRLIETTLPLCRELAARFPNFRMSAQAVIGRIERAIVEAGGYRPRPAPAYDAGPTYPAKGRYPFPMYCELSMIGGLQKELETCERLLAQHAKPWIPTIAVIRLDANERIYAHCNFKNSPDAQFKYKFCDTLTTTLGMNLRTLVVNFGVGSFLFVEEPLKQCFDEALLREGLAAKTRLVS